MVHGGKLKDLSSLNKRAEEFIDEFKQAQVHLAVLTWQQHNGDVWQPPSSTKYKFNFGAAIFLGLDRFGNGAVIRNDKGEVMAAMTTNGLKVNTSEEVELQACRRAFEFAVDVGFSRLII